MDTLDAYVEWLEEAGQIKNTKLGTILMSDGSDRLARRGDTEWGPAVIYEDLDGSFRSAGTAIAATFEAMPWTR